MIDIVGEKYRYREYLDTVKEAAFILPLVDSTSFLFQPYLGEKITTSLALAIATARIPVVHEAIARLYGVEDMAVMYEDGGLADAMRRAMSLTADDRTRMVSCLQNRRASLLKDSVSNLGSTMYDLGLLASRACQ